MKNQILFLHLFNLRYYDLSSAGRYKMNHKLRVSERLYQRVLSEPLYDINGEKVLEKGTLLTKENIDIIKEKFVEIWGKRSKTGKNFKKTLALLIKTYYNAKCKYFTIIF